MNILSALIPYGLKQTGTDKFICRCPAHNDKSPSMAVKLQPGDKTLIHCFAGCEPSAIMETLGLSYKDLFPESDYDKNQWRQKKQSEFLKDQFIHDYVIVKLAEAWKKRNKTFSDNDRNTVKHAINRINQYKFNADEKYLKLAVQQYHENKLNGAYSVWCGLSLREKYND